jgi:O-methyltransferase
MDQNKLLGLVAPCILGNYTHPLQTLEICEAVKDIEGDFCECGVAYGGMSALMANFIVENKLDKTLFMADSFEGIPYPTENDDIFPDGLDLPKTGELKSSGISASSLLDVLSRFKYWNIPFNYLNVYEGWLENTIELLERDINRLAFLRIDVDLYRPTKLCLDYLGPKVSKGGIILVHDLMPGCDKAVNEYIEKTGLTIEMQPDIGGYLLRV